MAITYEEYLHRRLAEPTLICGPDVEDDRTWAQQHIPGLNPYAELEGEVRDAERTARQQAEAEPG